MRNLLVASTKTMEAVLVKFWHLTRVIIVAGLPLRPQIAMSILSSLESLSPDYGGHGARPPSLIQHLYLSEEPEVGKL